MAKTLENRDRSKWLVLGLFWLIYFFNQADRQVLLSVFPLVQNTLALTDTQLGLLGSSFLWVFALMVPIAGSLGDVVSRRMLIIGALVLWSAATLCSGLVNGFAMLLVFRALTGAGEAFYYPSANSIIADYHGQNTRSMAMGIHQTSVYLGVVASGALAGYVGQAYGWRSAFISFGGAGVLLALLAWGTLREPVRGQAESETNVVVQPMNLYERLRESFRSRTSIMLMLAFVGMKLVDAAYLTWMPTLLYRKFGLALGQAGFHATFWHHAGAAAGVLAGGKIADHFAVRTRLSRPLVQAVGLLLGAPFILLLGWSTDLVVVYGSLACFGIFRGLYDSNLLASLFEVVRPECRSTATGTMVCVAFLAGGVAPLVVGWLSGRLPLGAALSWTSVFYLISAVVLILDCIYWFRGDSARMRQSREQTAGPVAAT